MQSWKPKTRVVAGLIVSLWLAVLAGCQSAGPRKLPAMQDLGTRERGTEAMGVSVGDYENLLVNSPEMFTRESSIAARRELLRVNWAMQKALEDGTLRVRIIAPPLQLTGDPNIDRSATYEIVVLADGLGTNHFTNVYDVRVGPIPSRVVMGESQTAVNLRETDQILAEEELSRLRMDAATVTAGSLASSNALTVISNRTATARTAAAEALKTITNSIPDLVQTNATLSDELDKLVILLKTHQAQIQTNLTESVELTNVWRTATNSIVTLAADWATITNELARAAAKHAQLTNAPASDLDAINKAKAELERIKTTKSTIETNQEKANLEKTQAEANLKLKLDERKQLEDELVDGQKKHAETLKLHAAWEADLKARQKAEAEQRVRLEALENRLEAAKNAQTENEGVLVALRSLTDFWTGAVSPRTYISGYSTNGTNYPTYSAMTIRLRADVLKDLSHLTVDVVRKDAKVGEVEGRKSIADYGRSEAGFTSDVNDLVQINKELSGLLLAEDKRLEVQSRARRITALGVRLNLVSSKIATYGKHIELAIPDGAMDNSLVKVGDFVCAINTLTDKVNDLEKAISKIVRQQDAADAKAKHQWVPKSDRMDAMTSLTKVRVELARLSVLAPWTQIKNNPSAEARAQDGVVGRIVRGEQAIFRINVLRGVVKTTAFLLADDGEAQLFGRSFADQFYAAQVTFRNPNDKPILIYGNTMKLVVKMNALVPGVIGEDGEPVRNRWWATYEPLDADSIRRMIETEQEHSWQKWAELALDSALAASGGWVAVGGASQDFTRAFGVLSALAPNIRKQLEKDLQRYASNFRDRGLGAIEEIPPNGVLTRYVFLPKGPIYGTYEFDEAEANDLPASARENRWSPLSRQAKDFGKRALQPAYIFDIRREEVFVDGKRILMHDPLGVNKSP